LHRVCRRTAPTPSKTSWAKPPPRRTVNDPVAQQAPASMYTLRDGRCKYVHYVGHRPELFDLDTDPQEANDLGESPAHADIRARLQAKLEMIVDPAAIDAQASPTRRPASPPTAAPRPSNNAATSATPRPRGRRRCLGDAAHRPCRRRSAASQALCGEPADPRRLWRLHLPATPTAASISRAAHGCGGSQSLTTEHSSLGPSHTDGPS
jgi:hypothetical protein